MFLPLSQQLCQSQGHRCHKKAMSYFGPSTNQILNTEAPCGEEAYWVSIGPPAAPGALWLICQIRKRAFWMKILKPQIALCVLPAGVYLWHFWDVIKTRFRQAASVRTLGLQEQRLPPQTPWIKKHHLQAIMLSLKEWRSWRKNVTWERDSG